MNKEDEDKFYNFLKKLLEPEQMELLKKVLKESGDES